MGQLSLLRRRQYWPLFWTQFAGAFNDNVFKNATVLLVAYGGRAAFGVPSSQVVVLAGGIFILPFFLFSPLAGQVCDRLPKARLIYWIKLAEVGVMGLGALGFVYNNAELLLGVLFLMGLQSTFFGPAKYSILPELVGQEELVGANALVELGSFLAILLGTILGGVLIASGGSGLRWVSVAVLVVAGLGVLTSRAIPATPPAARDLKVRLNPLPSLKETWDILRRERSVFNSVLGISWFWLLGAAILSLLPGYCKDVLRGSESVVTLCLALFCVGIGIGSALCERLSRHQLELGLVPVGSVGLSLFLADLAWVADPLSGYAPQQDLAGVVQFLGQPQSLRICGDLLLMALFGGVFSVPLYTLLQERSPAEVRSRVVAGNNIMNALFMVIASISLAFMLGAGLKPYHVFLVLCLMNLAVAAYIYSLIPEFLLRFCVWGLSLVMYRLKVVGREHIPKSGPCVLVCNHVSFVDWMLIAAACPRPVRFVMYHGFVKLPLVGFLFRDAKVIPIAPAHEDAGVLDEAFDKIAAELQQGEIVCIFPEGKLTKDGEMNVFRTGIERIIKRTPVPVIPMALSGMWGSFFSKKDRAAFKKPFRRVWSKVTLTIGEAVPPSRVEAVSLGQLVAKLGSFTPPRTE